MNKLKKNGRYLILDRMRQTNAAQNGMQRKSLMGQTHTIDVDRENAILRDSIAWYICNTDDHDTLCIVNSILSIRHKEGHRT